MRPNFAKIVSEKFNGGSGDMVSLFEVSKLLREQHIEWCNGLLELIKIMEDKDFYEDIILSEIKKRYNF